MTPIIDVRGLNFSYGFGELEVRVLKDLNLTVYPGEIVLLTAPSGSGKTTFLGIISALLPAKIGSVKVFGRQLIGADENLVLSTRRNIGYMFQKHNLFESHTALQNVCLALELQGEKYTEAQRIQLATELLTEVGLKERLNFMPKQLSTGQSQSVSIARALATKPKLIVADEPTASLDEDHGQQVVKMLKNLSNRDGSTIFMATHDERIFGIATKILKLENGCIKDIKL